MQNNFLETLELLYGTSPIKEDNDDVIIIRSDYLKALNDLISEEPPVEKGRVESLKEGVQRVKERIKGFFN